MLQIKKYEGADKEMDEHLRMCISTNERDHKKFLQIYKTGTKLDKFGSDLLIFVGPELERIGRIEKITHFFILLICISAWNAKISLFIYVMLHLLIMMAGRWIIRFSSGKLDAIQEECTKHYDKFRYDMYRKNGIMQNSENGRDEICFENSGNMKVVSGMFTAEFNSGVPEIYIGCRKNKCDLPLESRSGKDLCSMRHNIASVEFTDKFDILVEEGTELKCMKYLTPTRQLAMIQAHIWDDIRQMTFYNGRIVGYMTNGFGGYIPGIDVYNRKSILKSFEDVENYCQNVGRLARSAHSTYLQLEKIM